MQHCDTNQDNEATFSDAFESLNSLSLLLNLQCCKVHWFDGRFKEAAVNNSVSLYQ